MAIERDIYTKADGVKIPIDYVQNTNAIPIIFHFRDFQIPAGATAQVFVHKPSGLAVYNAATISGNDVTVDVTTQMMAEVGFNKLQIQVMSGDDNLVTFVQPVNVRQNYTDGESEESKNESSFFEELQEAAQAANTAAEAANSAAEEIEAKAEAGDFSSTVTVGSTTTGEPGSQASVTNSGTAQNPVLDFVIPTGAQGPQGPKGDPGSAEDIDTTPVTFEQASTRENVASGDTVATLFGKISKWFSDLGTAAFKGVSNVLTQTSDGYVLDARQGNVLSKMIGVLDNLATTAKTNLVAAINECAMKIGNLTELTTDEKTDLVSAINETNAGLKDVSFVKTSGFLGGNNLRPYELKKYSDGSFKLLASAYSTNVSFALSSSVGLYFALVTIPLPEELSVDVSDLFVFSGSIISGGIYFITPSSISEDGISVYFSCNKYAGIPISEIKASFVLEGKISNPTQ